MLSLLLGTGSGCATILGVADENGGRFDCCCGDCVEDGSAGYSISADCLGKGCRQDRMGRRGAAFGLHACGPRGRHIQVGPPAIRHQPEMPPEFLPVPVTPIYAHVNPRAPDQIRGAVEVGWPPPCQLTISGRD